VNSITSQTSFEYHNDSYFDGNPTFSTSTTLSTVPEPSSVVLLATASAIGVVSAVRRGRASSRCA
jgi:PEP-CTERM motif